MARLIPVRSHRVVLRLPSSVALRLVNLDASGAEISTAHFTRNCGRADGARVHRRLSVCCREQSLEPRVVTLRKRQTRKENAEYTGKLEVSLIYLRSCLAASLVDRQPFRQKRPPASRARHQLLLKAVFT